MAIDWTKPIRQKNGRAARLVTTLLAEGSKYVKLVVLTDNNGYESVAYYTEGGTLGLATPSAMDLENIPATAEAQPEIDWAGEVQFIQRDIPDDTWDDVTIVWHNEFCAVGWQSDYGPMYGSAMSFREFEFRNKPAEPKPVQAILKLWRSAANGTLTVRAYLKNGSTTVESVRVWHPEDAGKLLSVVEIDLHEGEGLEGEK